MRAVILAAGSGRRMRPFSEDTPKPLLRVGGRAAISWSIDALAANGIRSVTVVIGHRAADVARFVTSEYPDLEIDFVLNHRYSTTNTMQSLVLALRRSPPGTSTVVAEADVLCDEQVIADLVEADADDVAVVSEYGPEADGTAVRLDDGLVSEFVLGVPDGVEPLADVLKTVNVYRFSADVCRTILDAWDRGVEGVDESCFYEAILQRLTARGDIRLRAQVIDPGSWVELDDPKDLQAGRFRFEPEHRAAFVERAKGGFWGLGLVDFAHMANRRFPPPRFMALLTRRMADLVVRYGSSQEVLDEKLSYHVGCAPDRLLCLNGASQLYPILADVVAGRPVVVPDPTFGEYERLGPSLIRYRDQIGWDPETVGRQVPTRSTVVFVNPNNPTGTTRPPEAIHEFARNHPELLVVVDESFIDFAAVGSVLGLLERDGLDNVLVVSSLGKALGLPGVRLGFAYTRNADLRAQIARRSPIWPVNSVAECVLELLPRFREELAASFAETIEDRTAFGRALESSPVVGRVHPSGGNFLLVDLAQDSPLSAAAVRTRLLERHDVLVKDVSGRFAPVVDRLRLAVRLPDENARLVACLEGVVAV